jgi:hypothetical protein
MHTSTFTGTDPGYTQVHLHTHIPGPCEQMNESISRAAGAAHGQEMTPRRMLDMAAAASSPEESRTAYQRTTLYDVAADACVTASLDDLQDPQS